MAKKPLQETRLYQRRQAAIQRKKRNHAALKRRREVAGQARKQAVEKLAEEAFGDGGLTPARQEALSAVVLGPEGGQLSVTSPIALRRFINQARKKLHAHAENYVNIHLASTAAAHAAGEYDVAARHAEWAIEALGEGEERVVTPAPRGPAQAQVQPIMVGVSLGGGGDALKVRQS